MRDSEKYIWLFGENVGRTANNNSFWMWKFIIAHHNDVNAFYIAEKTAKTKAAYYGYGAILSSMPGSMIWRICCLFP